MHGVERRMSRRDRMLCIAVPLVLVLVAGFATLRYHLAHQSSWQGASFGMFATYEHREARTIRATGFRGDDAVRVPIPEDVSRLASRVVAAPGDEYAERLARELRERSRSERLVLEVWGHSVQDSDEGLSIGLRPLRRVEVS